MPFRIGNHVERVSALLHSDSESVFIKVRWKGRLPLAADTSQAARLWLKARALWKASCGHAPSQRPVDVSAMPMASHVTRWRTSKVVTDDTVHVPRGRLKASEFLNAPNSVVTAAVSQLLMSSSNVVQLMWQAPLESPQKMYERSVICDTFHELIGPYISMAELLLSQRRLLESLASPDRMPERSPQSAS